MMTNTISKKRLWSGRVLSGLPILFLMLDGLLKLAKPAPVVEACERLGLPLSTIPGIGLVLIACVVLYAVPRTAVLGAVLLTGYLGGAIAIHVRVEDPLFSHTLFPLYVGAMIWGGLALRDRRLWLLLGGVERG